MKTFLLTLGLKIEIVPRQKNSGRIFRERELKYNEVGYWSLEPLISSSELESYYESEYWLRRGGKVHGTIIRDHLHLAILSHFLEIFLSEPRTILNFGAGHGGISHLLWIRGHNIINVEPSGLPNFYEHRWGTYLNLSSVPSDSIDLVYGSHSLEHVHNIEEFLKLLKTKIKSKAYVFWEVPNADAPGNGPQEGKIEVPHTYYFQRKFFDNEFSQIILNDSFKSRSEICSWETSKRNNGNVIRVLGAYSRVVD